VRMRRGTTLEQLVQFVARRIRMLAARAVLRRVDDAQGIQHVQLEVLKGEVRGKLEHFQTYGFTSHPKPGAEAAVIFIAGNRAHGLVVAIDDRRYRLHPLEAGEVALYTDEGDKVHLKRDQKIDVISGGEVKVSGATLVRIESAAAIELEAPDVSITAESVAIDASTSVTIDAPLVSIQGKPDFKTHQHSGVDTGPGNTGGVV